MGYIESCTGRESRNQPRNVRVIHDWVILFVAEHPKMRARKLPPLPLLREQIVFGPGTIEVEISALRPKIFMRSTHGTPKRIHPPVEKVVGAEVRCAVFTS